MAFIQPLDLQTILVNYLSGSNMIFLAISIIAIAGMAAFFRMPNSVMLILLALFGLMMSQFIEGGWVVIIILLISGYFMGYVLSKLLKK